MGLANMTAYFGYSGYSSFPQVFSLTCKKAEFLKYVIDSDVYSFITFGCYIQKMHGAGHGN